MRSGESETPPIYKQLSSEISDRINRGKLSPGEQLPSERELGLRHKISRMTARQVYRHLEERGLVSRSDRRGWFVAEGPFQFSLTRSASFTNNLMAQGIQTGMEVLHCARIRAPSLVRMSLRLRNGQYVQSIKRLLAIRGQPALTETVCFPSEAFPGILDLPLTGSLLSLWQSKYGVAVGRSENAITGGYLSLEDARLLKVRKGSAGIFLSQTIYDKHDLPVAYARQNCRLEAAEFFVSVDFDSPRDSRHG